MPTTRYAAVTLDAYGTLFHGGSDELIAILDGVRREHALAVTLDALLKRREAMIRELERKEFMTMRERDRWIFRTLWAEHEIPGAWEPHVERLYRAYFAAKPFPDALPALDALRARGLKLAILSNADRDMMRELVTAWDLEGVFDAVVTSEAARCYKPGRAVFDEAASALQVPADAILHVGDSFVADVVGAKRAGYGGAAWIDRPGGLPAPARREAEPDLTLPSLDGLAARVAPQP